MADYFRVCAIDAGYRNFAWCVVDNFSYGAPLEWHHEDLWPPKPGRNGKPTKEDLVAITVAWARRNWAALTACDSIVLENQMRIPFIVMNSALHALFFKRVRVVHPMTVAALFRLPKTREAKKAAGVKTVLLNCPTAPQAGGRKLDDMADAWLMAVFQLIALKGISANDIIFLED